MPPPRVETTVATDPEADPDVRVSERVVRVGLAPEPVVEPEPPAPLRGAVPEPEAVTTVVKVEPALLVVVRVTAIAVVTGPTTPMVLVKPLPAESVPVVMTTVAVPAVVV